MGRLTFHFSEPGGESLSYTTPWERGGRESATHSAIKKPLKMGSNQQEKIGFLSQPTPRGEGSQPKKQTPSSSHIPPPGGGEGPSLGIFYGRLSPPKDTLTVRPQNPQSQNSISSPSQVEQAEPSNSQGLVVQPQRLKIASANEWQVKRTRSSSKFKPQPFHSHSKTKRDERPISGGGVARGSKSGWDEKVTGGRRGHRGAVH